MAMTLRLDDGESDALRQQAVEEGRSMQEVARSAVREYVDRRRRRAAVVDETAFVVDHYAEALDELGRR